MGVGFLGTGGFVKHCPQPPAEAGGEGTDCVSRPPFVFIITPGALRLPWQPRLEVAKFKTIYFQARSFADITCPHEKGNEVLVGLRCGLCLPAHTGGFLPSLFARLPKQ